MDNNEYFCDDLIFFNDKKIRHLGFGWNLVDVYNIKFN
jgi:hypothetical protein